MNISERVLARADVRGQFQRLVADTDFSDFVSSSRALNKLDLKMNVQLRRIEAVEQGRNIAAPAADRPRTQWHLSKGQREEIRLLDSKV